MFNRNQGRRRGFASPAAPPRPTGSSGDLEFTNALEASFGRPLSDGTPTPDHLKPKMQADPRFVNPASGVGVDDGLVDIIYGGAEGINRRLDARTPAENAALPRMQAAPQQGPYPSHAGTNLKSFAEPLIQRFYLTRIGRLPTPEEVLLHTDQGRRSKDINYAIESLRSMSSLWR